MRATDEEGVLVRVVYILLRAVLYGSYFVGSATSIATSRVL